MIRCDMKHLYQTSAYESKGPMIMTGHQTSSMILLLTEISDTFDREVYESPYLESINRNELFWNSRDRLGVRVFLPQMI